MTNTANFLSHYAVSILASGSTSARCEKTVQRIAKSYGQNVEMTILPRSVMMTLWDENHQNHVTISEKLPPTTLNFKSISLLSQLSWQIRDESLPIDEAWEILQRILSHTRLNSFYVTLLTGLANTSFCRLFDGDRQAMVIVFIATVNGFWLKNILYKNWNWDVRLCTLLAACSSSIIASSGYLLGVSSTPDVAVGTSVLYLVPGIPYINSVCDLIDGHLLCCLSRFIHASVLTVCLGLGLSLGIMLMSIHFF